jgi:hypothetical protein
MAFLRSVFQKKKESPPREANPDYPLPEPAVVEAGVATLQGFCQDIRRLCPEAFENDRAGLAALSLYAYGGLIVLTERRGYAPSHARVIYHALLRGFFRFAVDELVVAREGACFEQSSQPKSNFYPIIHRGVHEFRKWQEHCETFDAADFRSLMATGPWRPK